MSITQSMIFVHSPVVYKCKPEVSLINLKLKLLSVGLNDFSITIKNQTND